MRRTLAWAVAQLALPVAFAGPAFAADVESTVLQFGNLVDSGTTPAGGIVISVVNSTNVNINGFLQSGGGYGFGGVFIYNVVQGGAVNYDWLQTTPVSGEEPDVVSLSSASGNGSQIVTVTLSTGGTYHNGQVLDIITGDAPGTLCTFQGNTDGNKPRGPALILEGGTPQGFLATAVYGGTGYGVIEGVTASSKTTVHTFSYTDGAYPSGSLAMSKGNIYGTTTSGGAYGYGTVYELPAGGGLQVLYSFKGGTDGATPMGGVIADSAGNLYGTTAYGGTGAGQGNATIFEIATNGTKTTRYNMDGHTGAHPTGNLVLSPAGDLYGTTDQLAAKPNAGTVFKVTTAGVGTTVHRFATTDGYAPLPQIDSGVVSGVFTIFGATASGGANNAGVVFKVTVTQ